MSGNLVVIVTSTNAREMSTEDDSLLDALGVLGVNAKLVCWDDPDFGWYSASLTILRTTWDYHHRLPEFAAWISRVERETTLLNPPSLVRWNWDKNYLLELEAKGVPIVPTVVVDQDLAHVYDQAWSSIVVKPTVAGGAYETLVYEVSPRKPEHPSWEPVREHVGRLRSHSQVLVQPYIDGIVREGETSLVLFDGEFHHAVTKKPKPGDFRVQVEFGGRYTVVEPSEAQLRIAEQCIEALPEIPLYARVDLVEGSAGPMLMELELIEPELFLLWVPEAALTLADLIREKLSEHVGIG